MFDQDILFKVKNLHYEYNIYSVLRGIDFRLKKGENIVFFGMENSGVNLLFPIFSGMYKGYRGNVIYKDNILDASDYHARNRIRREIIYMQKEYGLISNMSVEENIALPLEYHTTLAAEKITDRVEELINQLELVYCRDMRPVNIRLSETLRTAYARAIALDPDLLLVEHPLEGQCLLDQVSFTKLLKERCNSNDKAVLITTYKPKYFIDFSNRFIMLHNGNIVFDGNAEELTSKENLYVKQFLENSLEGPMNLE